MNGILLQGFEWHTPDDGKHWRRLARMSRRLRRMGCTAVWLPPACKGSGGIHDVGYGIYDLYDLGEFDQKGTVRTKYGTKDEYIACVRSLQREGLQVLADIVLNHRLGADETETLPVREVPWHDRTVSPAQAETRSVYTRFTFPGRGDRWSDFAWDSRRFTAVDYWDGRAGHLVLLPGKRFAPDVDGENGNYDYLMGADVDVLNHEVTQELVRWGWWLQYHTGIDGFRLDAVKHISAEFYRGWLREQRRFSGRELFTVGEYWHGDVGALLHYLNETENSLSLFDVPLHMHFFDASNRGADYDLRDLFRGTLVGSRPTNAVTFVDNHDTQPGQSLQSRVGEGFRLSAYALILLRAFGYPCVFWGDLFGLREPEEKPLRGLTRLMKLRRIAAHGEERDHFDDDPHCIGFVREGGTRLRGLACVIGNNGPAVKRMCCGKRHAGQRWRCVLGGRGTLRLDENGEADFPVTDGLSVWVPAWQWLAGIFGGPEP